MSLVGRVEVPGMEVRASFYTASMYIVGSLNVTSTYMNIESIWNKASMYFFVKFGTIWYQETHQGMCYEVLSGVVCLGSWYKV